MSGHICRDAGYSPYTRACPACISQLSKNGWMFSNKPRRKNQEPVLWLTQ